MHLFNKILRPFIFLQLPLAFFTPIILHAQPEGYKPVADPGEIMQKVNEVAASTNAINAHFVQEKNISFIEEKIISKGILLYQKPDKLRLEYTEPFTYSMIMNGGRMMTGNGDKKSEYDLKSNKMFSAINNLIIGSVQGNILNNPDFGSSVYESAENLYINLTPLNKELNKYIKSIGLFIGKKDYTVSEIQITEQSDDYTLIKFINKVINEDIPVDSFHLQ